MNWLSFLIQPSSKLAPPTNSVTCDKHHACSAVPNSGSHAQRGHHFFSFNFVNNWKKEEAWLLFPAVPYLSRSPLMCEAVCEHGLVFVTLQPLQHPVGKPLCWMHLQGMVFVRAWAKATTSNPLLSFYIFFSEVSEPESSTYKLATSLTWSKQDLRLIENQWRWTEGSPNVLIHLNLSDCESEWVAAAWTYKNKGTLNNILIFFLILWFA